MPGREKDTATPDIHRRTSYIEEVRESPRLIRMDRGELDFDTDIIARVLTRHRETGQDVRGIKHYESIRPDQGIENIKELYGLGEDTYVTFGVPGSNYVLREVIRSLKDFPGQRSTHLWGIGPCFPNAAKFAIDAGLTWGSVTLGLNNSLEKTIERAMKYHRKTTGRMVYYLSIPTTPKGENADLELKREFAKFCARFKYKVIFDEAFALGDPKKNSAARLVEEFPEVAVLGSLGKIGLPGERVGYSIMSKLWGNVYQRRRLEYDVPGRIQLMINDITDPSILGSYLEKKREEVIDIKRRLVSSFDRNGIPYLSPTSDDVPIMTVYGYDDHFCERAESAGILLARGSGFASTHEKLSDMYGRMTVPNDPNIIPVITRRLRAVLRSDAVLSKTVPPSDFRADRSPRKKT